MSSPKVPKKSQAQIQLERQQQAAADKAVYDSAQALARKKDAIARNSIGRRSLLTIGELGTASLPTDQTNVVIEGDQ